MRGIVLLLIGVLASGCDRQKPEPPQADSAAAGAAAEPQGAGLDRSHAGTRAPDIAFTDAEGRTKRMADFAGAPVLVNLWASWCAPCVKELPSLDALAARPDAPRIVALSQDTAPLGSVRAFWDKRGLARLTPYHDEAMAFAGATGAQVLPTSIYYDAEGREIWRYVGDRDWAGEEARALFAETK